MADGLLIQNETLVRRLLDIAQQRNQSVEAVLEEMVAQYAPAPQASASIEAEGEAKHRLYARARRYWESIGDHARAALRDEDLDQQFWVFDHEGIPRLKSDQRHVAVEDYSLVAMVEAAEKSNFTSWRTDLSERTDELLGEALAKHQRDSHVK